MARPPRERIPKGQTEDGAAEQAQSLIRAAFQGRNDDALAVLRAGAQVDARHEKTGLTPLHIAVGSNNLELARLLVEEFSAPFGPDAFGRWPTTVAAECRTDVALLDYIVEAEAVFLERETP
ncbi:ankyrin repeat domain-containing protein [Rhodosalinus sp. 5P4]|uniref:ankyrin repeat domain-containing protein n=1 Tax=Rhodosalinus sp. 5P4 TaxID=3239196 RepID=UPI003523CBC1